MQKTGGEGANATENAAVSVDAGDPALPASSMHYVLPVDTVSQHGKP